MDEPEEVFRTTVYLPMSDYEWLRHKAVDERTTMADLIRKAVKMFRESPPGEQERAA